MKIYNLAIKKNQIAPQMDTWYKIMRNLQRGKYTLSSKSCLFQKSIK